MAAALDAEYCEICSDVDGVYTADPRVVPEARRIDALSYEETQELAECGAKVLNAQAVEFAKEQGIAIYARATASALPGPDPSADGTVVRRHSSRLPGTVVGVASEKDVLLLDADRTLPILQALDDHHVAGKQLHIAHEDRGPRSLDPGGRGPRSVDAAGRLSLIVSRENLHDEERVRRALTDRFGVTCRIVDHLGAVSVVGAGINASFQNVRRGTAALEDKGLAVRGIATSSFRITWLVDRGSVDDAVRLLHEAFIQTS
jgi:aspartate kinase